MSDPNEVVIVPEEEQENTETAEQEVVEDDPEPSSAETLTFADGTTADGHILPDGMGLRIYVYLDDMSLPDGYVMMSNADKTSSITAYSHGTTTVYEGFTEIIAISTEFGNCNLVMRKVQA